MILGQSIFFQEINLEGKYSMYFEDEYVNQNCTIDFNKSTYERKLSNGKKVSGTIEIQKLKIVLKDIDTPFEMIMVKSRANNDTIPFRTVDTTNKSKLTGDVVFHKGRLIKIN